MQGIMLLSKVRERDIVGNTIPENMVAAEKRLEELSEATIREAEAWDWSSSKLAAQLFSKLAKAYSSRQSSRQYTALNEIGFTLPAFGSTTSTEMWLALGHT